MKKVYIIIISTIILILIICGIEFFINNNHEKDQEGNIVQSNENTTVDENYMNYENNNRIQEPVNQTIEKVEMKIKEGTLTKTSAIVEIIDKNEEPYGYEQWFIIERDENGEWKELPIINQNHSFTALGYIPKVDETIEMKADWEDLYGKLTSGKYRLVKKILNNYIYVEFTI